LTIIKTWGWTGALTKTPFNEWDNCWAIVSFFYKNLIFCQLQWQILLQYKINYYKQKLIIQKNTSNFGHYYNF
jgi:hypothetical protein